MSLIKSNLGGLGGSGAPGVLWVRFTLTPLISLCDAMVLTNI